jgi:hypothetical protein
LPSTTTDLSYVAIEQILDNSIDLEKLLPFLFKLVPVLLQYKQTELAMRAVDILLNEELNIYLAIIE